MQIFYLSIYILSTFDSFLLNYLKFTDREYQASIMKFFAVFAAVLALAASTPGISTWNLHDLAAAIENPNTDPAVLPYLEAALNQMMENAFSGQTPVSFTMHLWCWILVCTFNFYKAQFQYALLTSIGINLFYRGIERKFLNFMSIE